MNLTSYLFKRPASQNWHVRWMVPLAARKAIGRSEFTKSTRTTDRKVAESRAYLALCGWRSEIDAATGIIPQVVLNPAQPAPTAQDLDGLVIKFGFEALGSALSEMVGVAATAGHDEFEAVQAVVRKGHASALRHQHRRPPPPFAIWRNITC